MSATTGEEGEKTQDTILIMFVYSAMDVTKSGVMGMAETSTDSLWFNGLVKRDSTGLKLGPTPVRRETTLLMR